MEEVKDLVISESPDHYCWALDAEGSSVNVTIHHIDEVSFTRGTKPQVDAKCHLSLASSCI